MPAGAATLRHLAREGLLPWHQTHYLPSRTLQFAQEPRSRTTGAPPRSNRAHAAVSAPSPAAGSAAGSSQPSRAHAAAAGPPPTAGAVAGSSQPAAEAAAGSSQPGCVLEPSLRQLDALLVALLRAKELKGWEAAQVHFLAAECQGGWHGQPADLAAALVALLREAQGRNPRGVLKLGRQAVARAASRVEEASKGDRPAQQTQTDIKIVRDQLGELRRRWQVGDGGQVSAGAP